MNDSSDIYQIVRNVLKIILIWIMDCRNRYLEMYLSREKEETRVNDRMRREHTEDVTCGAETFNILIFIIFVRREGLLANLRLRHSHTRTHSR